MNSRPIDLVALVAALLALGLGGSACGSTSSAGGGGAPSAGDAAEDDFWRAFLAGDVQAIPAARDELFAAYGTEPDDAIASRLIGMSYATGLEAQPAGAGAAGPPNTDAIRQSIAYLKHATELEPDVVEHYTFYATGLLGLGRFGDTASYAEGVSLFDDKIVPALPILGNLARAPAYSRAPVGSRELALGVESYFLLYEACTGAHIDRDHPDLAPVVQAEAAGTFPDRFCGNLPHVPHSLEGALVMWGDMLVKASKVDAAKSVYTAAKTTRDFGRWRFRSVVDERLGSDLAARAALYADADATNDPPLGASPCLGCHEQSAP